MKILVGISGASGAIYGCSVIKNLQKYPVEQHLIISKNGELVLQKECGLTKEELSAGRRLFSNDDLNAPPSSGTASYEAMVIVPCSVNTASKIACGIADNLLTRSASVMLKERKKLILVVRETPLSTIHLENLLKLSREGVIIMPSAPAFYFKPETINDLVGFLTGKVLDLLGFKHDLYQPWGEEENEE